MEADTAVTGNVIENAPTAGIYLGWGRYQRDVSATGNIVRGAGVGIAVSVAAGAGIGCDRRQPDLGRQARRHRLVALDDRERCVGLGRRAGVLLGLAKKRVLVGAADAGHLDLHE